MADVRITGSANFQPIEKEYEKLARKTVQLENKNRQLTATVDRLNVQQSQHAQQQNSTLQRGLASAENFVRAPSASKRLSPR
jgi:hypothetical protein